jgi:hypothetical protein
VETIFAKNMETHSETTMGRLRSWRTSFYGFCRTGGRLEVRCYFCAAASAVEAERKGLELARRDLLSPRTLVSPILVRDADA